VVGIKKEMVWTTGVQIDPIPSCLIRQLATTRTCQEGKWVRFIAQENFEQLDSSRTAQHPLAENAPTYAPTAFRYFRHATKIRDLHKKTAGDLRLCRSQRALTALPPAPPPPCCGHGHCGGGDVQSQQHLS
jgi:hypothetical protein